MSCTGVQSEVANVDDPGHLDERGFGQSFGDILGVQGLEILSLVDLCDNHGWGDGREPQGWSVGGGKVRGRLPRALCTFGTTRLIFDARRVCS